MTPPPHVMNDISNIAKIILIVATIVLLLLVAISIILRSYVLRQRQRAIIAEATFQYATTEARDQNVVYFFRAMQRNLTTRRWLASKVLESFDMLEKRYTGTFTFNRLIDAAFGALASQEDYEKVAAFFKDKDTAAYDMQLHQTLDTIKFNVKWIEVGIPYGLVHEYIALPPGLIVRCIPGDRPHRAGVTDTFKFYTLLVSCSPPTDNTQNALRRFFTSSGPEESSSNRCRTKSLRPNDPYRPRERHIQWQSMHQVATSISPFRLLFDHAHRPYSRFPSLHVNRRTSTIVLNTVDLQLSDISLQVADRQDTCMALESASDSLADRGIIVFPEELPEDSDARLTINFKGRLTRSLRGYYMAVGGKDGKVVYSLTQFQPTSARRAFPCWDEPALKATFTITMLSKVDSVNLSNMMVKSEKACNTPDALKDDPWLTMKAGTLDDQSQWKITRFETTPPISTYLVAYANGPFKYLESSYKSPLSGKVRPLRIYATDDIIGQGHYTLEIAQKVMPLYEDVFDVEYPLPKLDFLTGLITGKTTCFLDNPNTNDVRHQLYVACTTSHEISHMWFGDITTMEWWDMLYLNEGFATLVGEIMILGRWHNELILCPPDKEAGPFPTGVWMLSSSGGTTIRRGHWTPSFLRTLSRSTVLTRARSYKLVHFTAHKLISLVILTFSPLSSSTIYPTTRQQQVGEASARPPRSNLC
ncbi:hypothetical protein NUW54_g9473 [Trametes sanguinea]|uniref:Uncharacterized protein n=1 Tax=Trametes sanguinea TaxID=158606 RepID=A0ACC1P5P3_9APHY|nr:hypothetical protein NUW54_g9473 [Trametes sanguinea]